MPSLISKIAFLLLSAVTPNCPSAFTSPAPIEVEVPGTSWPQFDMGLGQFVGLRLLWILPSALPPKVLRPEGKAPSVHQLASWSKSTTPILSGLSTGDVCAAS